MSKLIFSLVLFVTVVGINALPTAVLSPAHRLVAIRQPVIVHRVAHPAGTKTAVRGTKTVQRHATKTVQKQETKTIRVAPVVTKIAQKIEPLTKTIIKQEPIKTVQEPIKIVQEPVQVQIQEPAPVKTVEKIVQVQEAPVVKTVERIAQVQEAPVVKTVEKKEVQVPQVQVQEETHVQTHQEPVTEFKQQSETHIRSDEIFEARFLGLPAGSSAMMDYQIDTSFKCTGHARGYYADYNNKCKIYHHCNPATDAEGQKIMGQASHICPQGTLFDQQFLTCVQEAQVTVPCVASEIEKWWPSTVQRFEMDEVQPVQVLAAQNNDEQIFF